MSSTAKPALSGRAAFSHPSFFQYQLARFFIVLTLEMQSVAVGWQVYEITREPFHLGLVGLLQFLPMFALFLFAGHLADVMNRVKLLTICYGGFAVCSLLLLVSTLSAPDSVYPIYAVLALVGVVRAFSGPVSRALLPQLVPDEDLPNAVAWNGTFFQAATILGPAIGGVIYALFRGASSVYVLAILSATAAMVSTLRIRTRPMPLREREQTSLRTVLAGLRYIRDHRLVLGAISLDLFAVLLGGAVALLPVFAREILHTGPWGLGVLRSAPAVGAVATAIFLAYQPLRSRAGAIMLWCVGGFGVFTAVFGLSRSLALSFVALLLVGAADMVSVVVRATLIQLATPDAMRGRVNAVELIFVGASNELGQFESGLAAHWLGPVPAVVLGGIGTIAVTLIWAWRFPELRRVNQLTDIRV
ncbi:MAG: MFS transporter [Candidatus Korobacteraceae bacterium]